MYYFVGIEATLPLSVCFFLKMHPPIFVVIFSNFLCIEELAQTQIAGGGGGQQNLASHSNFYIFGKLEIFVYSNTRKNNPFVNHAFYEICHFPIAN